MVVIQKHCTSPNQQDHPLLQQFPFSLPPPGRGHELPWELPVEGGALSASPSQTLSSLYLPSDQLGFLRTNSPAPFTFCGTHLAKALILDKTKTMYTLSLCSGGVTHRALGSPTPTPTMHWEHHVLPCCLVLLSDPLAAHSLSPDDRFKSHLSSVLDTHASSSPLQMTELPTAQRK